MTEWVVAAKLVAPNATKIAGRLASRATLRMRVARQVRRGSGISFPRRRYLDWLRTLDAEALGLPIEQARAAQATSLDACLATNDRWVRRDGHEADAGCLVELTYLVLLKEVDPGQARVLQERWAKARHDQTLRAVETAVQAFGGARLPRNQFIEQQRRASDERRAIRLAALGYDDSASQALLDVAPLGDVVVPRGGIRLLLGPLGSGKSEVAERWFRQKLDEFESVDAAPVPAWVAARDVVGDLESAVAAAVGGRDLLSSRGVALVLDGLDETDTTRAVHLLAQGRILTSAVFQSSVLATSRSGIAVSVIDPHDQVTLEPLSPEGAAQLIQCAAALPHPPGWEWPDSLRETVRQPFFALAAAGELRAGRRVGGRAGLMRAVVDAALVRGREREQSADPELFAMLVRLAVEATISAAAVDARAWSMPQRLQLTATRLVTEAADSFVFTLPLFEQWFAAQALLQGDVTVNDIVHSPKGFDRWRWSLAIAVASGSIERVDEILQALVAWNPGAGGWVLQQASSGGFSTSGDAPPIDQKTSVSRMANALTTWDGALGPISPECFPHRADGRVRSLGIGVDGRRITLGWWVGPDRPEVVLDLPPEAHPFAPDALPDWRISRLTTAPEEDAWPWLLLRDDIAGDLSRGLAGSSLRRLIADGTWRTEFLYDASRTVAGQRSLFHDAIDAAQLRFAVDRLIHAVEDPLTTLYQLQGKTIQGDALLELAAWLDSVGDVEIQRPWPVPDVRHPVGRGLIWDLYSDNRLLEVTVEVLGGAVEVYQELATGPFGRFEWTLGLYSAGDIGILATLDLNRDGFGPGIHYELLPLEIARGESAGHLVSSNGRAFVRLAPPGAEFLRDWDARRGQIREWVTSAGSPPFWRLSAGSSILRVTGNRPATAQAVDWLWDDLKPLGLASGAQPRLE